MRLLRQTAEGLVLARLHMPRQMAKQMGTAMSIADLMQAAMAVSRAALLSASAQAKQQVSKHFHVTYAKCSRIRMFPPSSLI